MEKEKKSMVFVKKVIQVSPIGPALIIFTLVFFAVVVFAALWSRFGSKDGIVNDHLLDLKFNPVTLASTEKVDIEKLKLTDSMDGVALSKSTRILLKDQFDETRGIYVWDTKRKRFIRAPDFNTPNDIKPGYVIFVEKGRTQANSLFYVSYSDTHQTFSNMSISRVAPNSIHFKNADGDAKFTIQAPLDLASDQTWTLPETKGIEGNFLSLSNNLGQLQWKMAPQIITKVTVPGINDYDYALGSLWFNQSTNALYFLADNTPNAAVWFKIVRSNAVGQDPFTYFLEVSIDPETYAQNNVYTAVGTVAFPGLLLQNAGASVKSIRVNLYTSDQVGPTVAEFRIVDINSQLVITELETASNDPSNIIEVLGPFNNVPTNNVTFEFNTRLKSGNPGKVRLHSVHFEISNF